MASVVDKPSKALEQIEDSQYVESECDESAYGSEDGRTIEHNSVEESQENIENNAQKLEYWKKSDTILRNLCTALKVENAELKKGMQSLEILNEQKHDALGKRIVLLENSNDVSQKLIVQLDVEKNALLKQADTLTSELVCEKEKCKSQVEALKENIKLLEEQCSANLQCKIEKEDYYISQVNSLQPLLEEAKTINENLVDEVDLFEKLVKKKDTNILILQERNYHSEVKLSKTRKYIKHREREYHQVLTQQGFQLSNLLNQATFNMKGAVHARNFMENRCKELEIALQNSSINMQHSSNELVAIKSQLKEAKKDFELSQKAYNDMRLEVKSNESLKKKLEEK